MKLLRNFFSGFIAFFLIPILLTFLFVNNFSRVLLDENQFLGILKENKTYEIVANEVLPNLVIGAVSADTNQGGFPKEVVSNVVASVDKQKLANDLEKVVGEVYRYTAGTGGELSAQMDLTPYVNTLQTQLKPVLTQYYQELPTCTAEEEQLQLDGGPVTCRIQGKSVETILAEAEIDKVIADLSVSAPRAVIVTKDKITTDPPINLTGETQINSNEESKFSLENIRNLTQALKTGNTYVLFVIGGLLLLLILSQFPHFTAISRWVSWVLVSAATLPLIASSVFLFLVKPQTLRPNLSSALDSQGTSYENTALTLLADNVSDLGHKIFQGIQIQSLILIVVAAALFFTVVVLDHRKRNVFGGKEEKS